MGKKVIGEVCHIKAQNKGGPRYDPNQTATERHGYDNLILMCSPHHTVIDDDEDTYTVEYLHRLKEKPEQTASKMSEEDAEQGALLLFLDQSVSSTNQSGGITAHTIHVHNYGPLETETTDRNPLGFVAAGAKDGVARFRAPMSRLECFGTSCHLPKVRTTKCSLQKVLQCGSASCHARSFQGNGVTMNF